MTIDRYIAIVRTISRHVRACDILAQTCDSFLVDRLAAYSYVMSYQRDIETPSIAFEPCL